MPEMIVVPEHLITALTTVVEYVVERTEGKISSNGKTFTYKLSNGVNVMTATDRHGLSEANLQELLDRKFIFYDVRGEKHTKVVWLPTSKGTAAYYDLYGNSAKRIKIAEPKEEDDDDEPKPRKQKRKKEPVYLSDDDLD